MISIKTKENMKKSSLIRAMFEEGESLRMQYGAENVFDFSLGNPDREPPVSVLNSLQMIVAENKMGSHRYMNNAGYTDVREAVASGINQETGKKLSYKNIIMTCGAGGALNVVLKTILNPGEEVIVFSPFFGEYKFYIDNHGGKIVDLPTEHDTFEPDLNLLEKSINPSTKAVIVNSPNNPTGVVYTETLLKDMASILERKGREFSSKIYLISDEPYSKLVYDNVKLPKILNIYKDSFIVSSFSKSHSLPGERIGYIVVNDDMENSKEAIDGMAFSNRILGFVNAPALFQKVIARTMNDTVDLAIYEERRNILYNSLVKLGFSCIKPQGAFYLFPKSSIQDDMEFKNRALKHNIIIVPGSGFGCKGYFRLAYCTSMTTIINSLPAFEKLSKEFL